MTRVLMKSTLDTVPTRVLICDSRQAARRILAALLTHPTPQATTVTAVADGDALLDSYTDRPADLVLIGVRRGELAGPDAVDVMLARNPSASVVVFGCSADADLLCAAISRGACGLLLWDFADGFRVQVWSGVRSPDPPLTGTLLTERESQVLLGMSQGLSNREIGRQLYLSEDTIKTHARVLYTKLNARDRAHAVARGMQHGVLT